MTTATREDVARLTRFARCAGCAAKMGPGDLATALAGLERRSDPRLLVGRETFDDAGIFQITDEIALVQTVDFFAPIVDDPYDFGRVAAANALSDVFAMGGEPLTAMNIVGFPVGQLPLEVLSDVLRGGQDASVDRDLEVGFANLFHEGGMNLGGKAEMITGPVVTQAAQEGDVAALRCFDVVGTWLGRGMAQLAAVLDPGLFVLGGGVSAAGELLRGPAGRALLQYLTARGHRPHAELRVAELGPEAGIVGAGDLARDR